MTKAKGGYKIREDGKKDTGRPTKLTPETILLLEQAFSMGCTDVEACLHANISKTALYNFQQTHPDFVDRKEQLKEKLVLRARMVVMDAIYNKDENTAKWYLERKKKNEFGTRQEITGADGSSVSVEHSFDVEKIKQLKDLIGV